MTSWSAELYVPGAGPLHRLPVTAKVLAALLLVIAIAMCPVDHARWLLAPAAVLIVTLLISGLPLGRVLLRLVCLEPLAAAAALMALAQPNGVVLFAVLLAKSTLCLLTMILLAATTPWVRLLAVLARWGVPSLLVTTAALMMRYLGLMVDQTQRMQRARLSRTFQPSRRRTWSDLTGIVAQLFIRAADRAQRVHAAMLARGWR